MAELHNHPPLRIGQGFRDNDPRRAGKRVLFITALDDHYAYVRGEAEPHRRSRIKRQRLESPAYSFVGEMGPDPEIWPQWFREEVEGS